MIRDDSLWSWINSELIFEEGNYSHTDFSDSQIVSPFSTLVPPRQRDIAVCRRDIQGKT